MNSSFCNASETVMFATEELTELVRGYDEGLVERVAPLVRQHSVSLDLGRVERIDAAGIAALISLYGLARNAGHDFKVMNATVRVAEILAIVGLDSILLSHNAVQESHTGPQLQQSAA